MTILHAKNLSKTLQTKDLLHGKFEVVLWQIPELRMEHPGFYVLAGRNGCGKSTLLRSLLGLIHFDTGTVSWFGKESFSVAQIGYLPEFPILPPAMKVRFWLSCLLDRNASDLKDIAERLRKYPTLAIDALLNIPANRLSKGQQQRVQLWAALAKNPAGLILDEPFSGLDPWARTELASLLGELLDEGKFILMSTHELPELLRMRTRETWIVGEKTVRQHSGCQLPN